MWVYKHVISGPERQIITQENEETCNIYVKEKPYNNSYATKNCLNNNLKIFVLSK